ncbi:MAG TPA: queuosine precursor transporter [Polyangiaceae bacterium]|nr:queuosine precursor transporter [Polyangiaceae bacterium]
MQLDARTRLFIILAGIFSTCLIIGDVTGAKLVTPSVFAHEFGLTTVGMIPFPVTFLLTDVLNEFYGKRAARFVTLYGFGLALLAYSFIFIAGAVPIAALTKEPGWTGVTEGAFNTVFLGSRQMILASLSAYLVGQFVDIGVFNALKRATGSRFIWLRATGSTLVSQLIDTLVVSIIAWNGQLTAEKIKTVVVTNYTLKLLIAIGLTPVIYAIHAALERWLGLKPVALELKAAE